METLSVALPVLKLYETEIAKSSPSNYSDVQHLKACSSALQALQSEIPVHDDKFEDVETSLFASKTAIKPEDQDIAIHEPTALDTVQKWNDLKIKLNSILNEINNVLPNAENGRKFKFTIINFKSHTHSHILYTERSF